MVHQIKRMLVYIHADVWGPAHLTLKIEFNVSFAHRRLLEVGLNLSPKAKELGLHDLQGVKISLVLDYVFGIVFNFDFGE